jgi:hypothetical protein
MQLYFSVSRAWIFVDGFDPLMGQFGQRSGD